MNEKKITITIQGQKGSPFDITPTLRMWTLLTDQGEKKTMSKKIGEAPAGTTMEVEEYTNDKGKTYIRQIQDENGFAGGGGGKKGGFDTVGVEVGHAITNAIQLLIYSKDTPTQESIEKHAKMILAVGDKMKAERKGAPAEDKPPWEQSKKQTPLDFCKEANLGDRIAKSGMPESHIEQVWQDVGMDKSRLTQEINSQLTTAGF